MDKRQKCNLISHNLCCSFLDRSTRFQVSKLVSLKNTSMKFVNFLSLQNSYRKLPPFLFPLLFLLRNCFGALLFIQCDSGHICQNTKPFSELSREKLVGTMLISGPHRTLMLPVLSPTHKQLYLRTFTVDPVLKCNDQHTYIYVYIHIYIHICIYSWKLHL